MRDGEMLELLSGERQVAPDVSGIRRDHVARYEWCAQRVGNSDKVYDFGCGIGYGTVILAQSAKEVIGIDRSAEALEYAAAHYAPFANISYGRADLGFFIDPDQMDGQSGKAVAFEVIEHLPDPSILLRMAAAYCDTLFASVPNEAAFPYTGQTFHHRHYTKAEFLALLGQCGWEVVEWWGQLGPQSEVERDVEGRTLVAVARRVEQRVHKPQTVAHPVPAPEHVAIVGLGPSAESYMDVVKRMGSRHAFADQTWVINSLGDVLQCDLVFHMDDVLIQEIRAEARPRSNIANMLPWLRTSPVPVMTSIPRPGYPSSVAFPLEDVINALGRGYFNNTAAYAVAYAIYRGVKKISIFGCDYTYPDAHRAERGRACLEFWLGYAAHAGIEIAVPGITTLMDSYDDRGEDDIQAYGYDAMKVSCSQETDGRLKLTFTERDKLPTADEIEAAYDHTKSPVSQRRA